MKTSQAEVALSARVKLLKCQLLEWRTLLINQKMVRDLAYGTAAKKPIRYYNAVMTSADLIIRQTMHLSNLMGVHREELDQMKARHQQQDVDLEEVLESQNKRQTETP